MAIDRRVARTRNALYDALVTLILRKGYEATTVQDLLDEANVGRATFYSHFTSKEDLLARSLDRLRAILVAAVAESRGSCFGASRLEPRAFRACGRIQGRLFLPGGHRRR